MFCEKCGNELSEGGQFCGKCGNPIQTGTIAQPVTTQEISTSSANKKMKKEVKKEKGKEKKGNIIKRYINRWKRCKQEKLKGKKNIGWVAVNVIVVLLIGSWIHLFLNYNINMNGLIYVANSNGTATVTNKVGYYISLPLLGEELHIPASVKIGFKEYKIEFIDIGRSNHIDFTGLSNVERLDFYIRWPDIIPYNRSIDLNAMPRVKEVHIACRGNDQGYVGPLNIYASEHNALESIDVNGIADVHLTACNKLEGISLWDSENEGSDYGWFELSGEFPKLKYINTL